VITKVISGGQTGVDRAALDAAMAAGLPIGGWCPKGRRAEDGRIPECYPLTETPTARYAERTRRNVQDASATLILTRGEPTGGTALTVATCIRAGKPYCLVDLTDAASTNPEAVRSLAEGLARTTDGPLNIAGPRESEQSGVCDAARQFLDAFCVRVVALSRGATA
jgi:hypothetical protein